MVFKLIGVGDGELEFKQARVSGLIFTQEKLKYYFLQYYSNKDQTNILGYIGRMSYQNIDITNEHNNINSHE